MPNICRLDTQAKTSKYQILTKSSLAIKPISISMATLISRTAEHGPFTIQGQFSKHKSSTKNDCVVCTLCWRNHWTISFWNQIVVNSERYCAMLNNFLRSILEEYDIDANSHSNNGSAARGVSWMYIFPQQ